LPIPDFFDAPKVDPEAHKPEPSAAPLPKVDPEAHKPPPKPAPTPVPPQARPPPTPPAPTPPQPQQLKPSPLQTSPMKRVPDSSSNDASATFVNPAINNSRDRANENYLALIARHIAQHRFVPRESVVYTRRGVIGVQMVIARDGRLVGVSVVQSSGAPTFDQDMMEFIRSIAPFPPLPASLPGSQSTFPLRIPYDLNPGG